MISIAFNNHFITVSRWKCCIGFHSWQEWWGRGQSSVGKLDPSPKINGGVSEVTFSLLNASPPSTPGSSEPGRNLAPAGWSSEKSDWGCKLRLSLPQLPQSQTGSRNVWKSGGNLGEDCNHTAKSHTVQAAAGLAPHFYRKKILLPLSMRAKYRGESFSL